MTAVTASAPPSPLPARVSSNSLGSNGSDKSTTLNIHGVANLFVRMRKHRTKSKAHHIESASGPPQTHPALAAVAVSERKVPLAQAEHFVCRDAVDVPKLLRAVRGALYEKALALGANVLVDEQWTSTVCGPRHRSDGSFRVDIRYSARAARSEHPDPQRPVALENARSVPGLMTIISRLE